MEHIPLEKALHLSFAQFVLVSLLGRVGVEHFDQAFHGALQLGSHRVDSVVCSDSSVFRLSSAGGQTPHRDSSIRTWRVLQNGSPAAVRRLYTKGCNQTKNKWVTSPTIHPLRKTKIS